MNKNVSNIKVKKEAKVVKPTKVQIKQKIVKLNEDRQEIGFRLVDLVEKANRLASAHAECKEQMHTTELDLLAVGKELRAAAKEMESAT